MQREMEAADNHVIKGFRAELKSNPLEVQNYLRLGWALYGQKDLGGAQEVLESAHGRFPDHYEVSYLLALIYKKHGEDDRAVKLFQQVEKQVENIDDPIRGHMLHRFAEGHINIIEKGGWELGFEES